jgi:hypothetical protein
MHEWTAWYHQQDQFAVLKKKKVATTQFPRRLIKEKAEVRQSPVLKSNHWLCRGTRITYIAAAREVGAGRV